MPDIKFPIKVKIKLLPASNGGRNIIRRDTVVRGGSPIIFNEYRTIIALKLLNDHTETNWSAFIELPDSKIFHEGHEYLTNMQLLAYDDIKSLLYIGQKFQIHENGIIGEGEILEIIEG